MSTRLKVEKAPDHPTLYFYYRLMVPKPEVVLQPARSEQVGARTVKQGQLLA